MTHRYAEALRWIADGEVVQHRLPGSEASEWEDFRLSGDACRNLIKGTLDSRWEFRLKPRTVKIGSREVEAPVLDPVKLTHVFFLDTSSVGEQCRFNSIVYNPTANPPNIEQLRSRGLLFASLEDAKAFHDALSELLTGGAT